MAENKKVEMRNAMLLFAAFLLTALAAEYALRVCKYKPGVFLNGLEAQNYWYEYDQNVLQECQFFKADSLGLFKANRSFLRSNTVSPPNFAAIISALKLVAFNSDGFRGREFLPESAAKARVFFIGDSYTFGFDAEPFDSSYVDLVQKMNPGIEAYNGGVPGADLASYAVVAENYAQKIKPDVIVVCINRADGLQYNKVLEPYQNSDIFMTSKGILFKTDFNYSKDSIRVFRDVSDAYESLIRKYSSKYLRPYWLKYLVERSALLTLVVGKIYYRPDPSGIDHTLVLPKGDFSAHYINRIVKVAAENKAKLVFTVIPGPQDFTEAGEIKLVRKITGEKVALFYPSGITLKEHYGKHPRMHFNNRGHYFYAEFLNRLISEELKK